MKNLKRKQRVSKKATSSSAGAPAGKNTPALIMALEPRIMFDAAVGASVDQILDNSNNHTTAFADQSNAGNEAHESDNSPSKNLAPLADSLSSNANTKSTSGKEIAFVDPRVRESEILLRQLKPGVEVVVLDPLKDGILQMTEYLQAQKDVSAIHVLSHGVAGSITVADTILTAGNIDQYGQDFAGWRTALTQDADILLYSCDLASTAEGKSLVDHLAALTGADIAASTNPTGAAAKGGDWTLEYVNGPIEAKLALTDQGMKAYSSLMAAPTVDTTATAVTVIEPSLLNAAGAGTATLAGWTITDDGLDSLNVTVNVVVGDTAKGTLLDPLGTSTAIAGGRTLTDTPANVQTWVNQLTFNAADVELGNSAATTTLTVTVIDGETSPLQASKSINVTITPSNDPVIVPDGTLTVTEGSGGTAVTAVTLAALDPEVTIGTQNTSQIVYRLTSLPTYGYLTVAGSRVGVGSLFTQAQVVANAVVYVHTATGAGQNTADNFSISVNDGATPQINSDTATVTINITPVNQAPTVSANGSIYEGQPQNAMTSGVPQSIVGNFIVATGGGDPGDAVLDVKITSLPTHGILYFNGTAVINGISTPINRALTAGDLAGSGFVIAYANRAGLTYSNDGNDPGGVPPDDTLIFKSQTAAAALGQGRL